MYRNKLVKGFISPLIAQSQTNVEENKVNTSQQEVSSDSIRKSLRSNAQLLSIFEEGNIENEVIRDNVEAKNNASKKQEASASIYEKNISIIDLPQTKPKMQVY